MPRGGRRPGAGRRLGSQGTRTLDKIAAREFVRQRVCEKLDALLEAQVANACGLKYLVARAKHGGKFLRVTKAMARHKANEDIIEVWEKDPSVQAFTDLLNRALDKPKEQELEIKVSGQDVLIARLASARTRVA